MGKAKGKFWNDTFEQLAELGTSTVKKSAKSVAKTFNPLELLEDHTPPSPETQKNSNHTPLDFEKLKTNYQKTDEQKTNALRQKLFQMVKDGEQQAVEDKRREEQEKFQQEQQDAEEKQKKEAERKRIQSSTGAPQGKERKSILGTKKRVQQEIQVETKPQSGKN